jgi:hypothetical protein
VCVDGHREIGVKARDQNLDLRGVSHGSSPMSRRLLHGQWAFRSGCALAAHRLALDLFGQLAAVMHQEAA